MSQEPASSEVDPRSAEAAEDRDADDLVVACATHPQVQTALRCGRCNTPICPKCLVMSPVGARCRACARLRKLPMFEAGLRHYLLALAAGAGAAALAAVALSFVPRFGFLTLLLYAALGYGVGEAVSLATNRKRATGIAVVAGVCAAFGAFVAGWISLSPLLAVVAAAVAAAVAWGRVR